jgi:mono/diheme cytochrome c family protein
MTVHTPIESRTRGIPRWALGLTGRCSSSGPGSSRPTLNGSNPPISAPRSHPAGTERPADHQASGCQACHGPDLAGQATFPNLHGVKNGPTSANLQQLGKDLPDDWANLWIAGTDPAVKGLDRGGMPFFGQRLSADEIATVVAYLKTLP